MVQAGIDFVRIYEENGWENEESRSGHGSTLEQTKHIRAALPSILTELKISTLLDLPCGDFNWMQHIDFTAINVKYIGGDMVQDMIAQNRQKYGNGTNISFETVDVLKDAQQLPTADAIFCRDLLCHLRLPDAIHAVRNMCKSGVKYLITTTFTDRLTNAEELLLDMWRPLNMLKPPFNFPTPLAVIDEKCTEDIFGLDFSDKCLGVWRISDIIGSLDVENN